jgi:hypothetical protein
MDFTNEVRVSIAHPPRCGRDERPYPRQIRNELSDGADRAAALVRGA